MENKLLLKRLAVVAPVLGLLLIGCVLIGGCGESKDPLTGWKQLGTMNMPTLNIVRGWTNMTMTQSSPYDLPEPTVPKAIVDDYQNFARGLPTHKISDAERSERYFILGVAYLEDATGQHAIDIIIPLNGTYVHYILIYDKDNKRVKTIRWAGGHYAC